MRKTLMVAVAGLMLVAGGASAQTAEQMVAVGEGTGTVAQLVTAHATVMAIDYETRQVVLKGESGREEAITAGPDIKNLADVKVGDEVEVQYYESLTLQLDQVTEGSPSVSEITSETRTDPGEIPGGVRVRQVTLTAKVTAVDEAAATVTLVGPKGRSVTLAVEPEQAQKVKVGDLVSATYTEALAISVSRVTLE